MSSPVGRALNFEIVDAALKDFGHTVACAGKRIFEGGSVRLLKEGDRPNTFEGEVADDNEKSKAHHVILAFGGTTWNLLCTCSMGAECKHCYAALLSLSKRYKKVEIASEKPEPSPKKARDFFALVADPAKLTERQTDFVERLDDFYRTHQDGDKVNGRVLKALFPKWPEADYWLEIPIAPRIKLSRLQFWHFVVVNLRAQKLPIPDYFGKSNDTSASADLIEDWSNQQTAEKWKKRYEESGVSVRYARLDGEFRWNIEGSEICLQVRDRGEQEFRIIQSGELHRLIKEWRAGRLQIVSDDLHLLLQHALADAYQPPIRLPIAGAFAARLNGLLRLPGVRQRICGHDQRPIELSEKRGTWEIFELSSQLYRLQLILEDRPLPAHVVLLPGPVPLYMHGSALFEANPPPFPLDSIECPTVADVPRAAIESIHGIQYVVDAIEVLPDSLNSRISRVRVKRAIRVRYSDDAIGIVVCLTPNLLDPRNGSAIPTLPESPWSMTGSRVTQDGGQFVVYDSPDSDGFQAVSAGLPAVYDPTEQTWRIKNSKRALELFVAWSRSLPNDVELELPEPLAGLKEKPVDIDFSIDCEDAGNDWFDLRLSWSESELTLSSREMQALLEARGEPVQFSDHGYRSARISRFNKLLSTLKELGLSLGDLTAGPQRLHLLHLRTLLEAKVVSANLHKQLDERLSEINMQVEPDVPRSILATLRPYQIVGFQFLAYLSANQFGGILADDMGLGKTLQSLSWLAWVHENFPISGPSLVVCPKSVVDNWITEAQRYYPKLLIAASANAELGRLKPGQLLVINYAQLRLLGDQLKNVAWDAVIFDEGQYLKTPTSQTTQTARALNSKQKILLTGTPIENKLLDLWSLMHCVMPGALGTQAAFKQRFQRSDDVESRGRLAQRVRPFLLRRTKEEVALDLPPKIEEDIRVSMEGSQNELYQAELKVARRNLLRIENREQLDSERFNLLTSLLRLRQICCHPSLIGSKNGETQSAKLEALLEMLEPLMEQGNKVLVFSQFVEMLQLIEQRTHAEGWPIFTLTGQTENRGDLVERFQNHRGAALFLISLKAGGAGLNLAAASYVVLFDPWWNPAVENQAIDRTHRIGQTKTVFAYRLLVRDSIEDKIRQLQIRKSNLAKNLLGEEAFGRALTLDDFQHLLG